MKKASGWCGSTSSATLAVSHGNIPVVKLATESGKHQNELCRMHGIGGYSINDLVERVSGRGAPFLIGAWVCLRNGLCE